MIASVPPLAGSLDDEFTVPVLGDLGCRPGEKAFGDDDDPGWRCAAAEEGLRML